MKSNVSGRVVPQSGSSSGCRPHNFFYNFHHQNQSQQQQQQHHHQQQQHNLSFHPHHQQQPPHHQNYAMLPCFNQHNTSGWAGIPLISTAASSNRRQRKLSSGTHSRHLPQQQHIGCNSLQMFNSNRDLHFNDYDLNPMTRLAMHTQGAPLLLAGSYNRNRQLRSLNPNSSEGYPTCGYKPNGPIHQKTKENNISGTVGIAGGVTNTQNDSTTMACLPRIIKPRKRRKKDRKPLPSTNNFVKKIDHESNAFVSKRDYPPIIGQHQQLNYTLPPSQMAGLTEFEGRCTSKNDEPNHVTDAQDPATGNICFCRQCDPLSRIWAFPLRRSHSDNSSDTTEFEKGNIKNVGVIGSNRSSQVNIKNTSHTGSLSDSSDSGYGDILSGIQIGDNLFGNDNNQNTNNDGYLQFQKLPNDLLLSPSAESLLTESINEISRKLMETCDIKGVASAASSSSSTSSDSCSVFSDSGLSSSTSNNPTSGDELIFNFENLSINSVNHSNLMFPATNNINNINNTNESMFDCFSTSDINNNTIHVQGNGGGSPRIDPHLFNCLDMLWGNQQPSSLSLSLPLPLHSDASKQTTSSSSSSSSSLSSSSSFYRPAIASAVASM